MNIIYNLAGIAVVVWAVAFIIGGLIVANAVMRGTMTAVAGGVGVVVGMLIGLMVIVFYIQVLAVVNGGDAWMFTWVTDTMKSLFGGGLPALGRP